MKFTTVLAVLVAIFALGCSHSKVVEISADDATVGKEKLLTMTIDTLKDKKKKYDFRMTLRNGSEQYLIVNLGDIRCFRGAAEGNLKHTFFNTGERTIDFAPGQTKSSNMVCDNREKTQGDFKVTIERVFSNPSKDRRTTGKVVGQNITWSVKEKQ